MKILVVDDSSFKRKSLAYVLEKHGHEALVAGDGEEGLEKARSSRPDIIVSDLLMPKMDGFNFLRSIKKDEQLKAIPFVVYSATYKEEKVKELVLSLGASGIVEDESRPEMLWPQLQEILGRVKGPQVIRPIMEEDKEFLKNYAHIVAAKLEEKVRELEEENHKRRLAEDALRESEEKFSHAFKSSPAMIAIATLDGKHVEVNKAYTDFLGYTREEILGKSVVDLQIISEDERQKLLELARKGGGSVYNAEIEVSLLDGSSRNVLFSLDTISIGGVPHSLATLLDITERRKAEEALRESEERFRVTFNQAAVGIAHVAPDGRWLSVNQKICDIVGYTRDELMKITFQDITYPDDLDADLEYVRQMLANKIQTYSMEKRYIRKDGSLIWINLTVSLVRKSSGEPQYFISVVEDISRRKKAEEEIRRLSQVVEQSPLSIFITDPEGNIEYVNTRFIETTGYTMEDVKGEKPDIFKYQGALISDGDWHGEILSRRKNGETFWEYSIISPVRNAGNEVTHLIGMHEDISQRKKAEEERAKLEAQLFQSQKMDALGRLAGGIAHDFNNALTAIIGYSELLLMKRGEDSFTKDYAEQIFAAGQSAARMVQSILSFSRKQTMMLKPVDIAGLVKNFQNTLLRLIREDIELKTVVKDTPLFVMADHTQIEQVLMNLSTNARDAMPHGGVITITTEIVNIDDGFVKAHGYGVPGRYAMLSFADTGTGMDAETTKKIFEPFFTTKEVGKGTGLGLAMIYGIVKQHEGFINVYSEPDKGTTFRVYLPLAKSAIEAEEVKEQPHPEGGGETILLVEDDERVRDLVLALLEDSGYNVIVAVNGEDGVNKFMENKDAIRLCICDMVMPRKGGREAYEEMKKIRPDIKVLFMSGYAVDEIKGAVESGLDFISKPFSPGHFLRKIREVIDR